MKTSVIPQLDFLLERKQYLRSHRPTKLTGEKNRRTLDYLKTCGLDGATALEIQRHYGWTATIMPRLAELRHLGLVRKTEARRVGQTVWVAT